MADNVRITQSQLALRGSTSSNPLAGNGANRGAQAPVNVTQPMAGDEFQRAVTKLSKNLDSGAPLRNDVPRGFYLNIRV